MKELLLALLGTAEVQTAIVVVLVAVLGWLVRRWAWMRHVAGLAIEAYQYAEQEGLLRNLRGYQKFDPFMDRFIARYEEVFGKPPDPKAKGAAVAVMEAQVEKEHAEPKNEASGRP